MKENNRSYPPQGGAGALQVFDNTDDAEPGQV